MLKCDIDMMPSMSVCDQEPSTSSKQQMSIQDMVRQEKRHLVSKLEVGCVVVTPSATRNRQHRHNLWQ
jgi:hypothetical protein